MKLKQFFAAAAAVVYGVLALPMIPAAAEETALGDVNADGIVDSKDAALILEDAAVSGSSGSAFTEAQQKAGDADANGTADAADAALILGYAALVGTGEVTTDLQGYIADNPEMFLSLSTPTIFLAVNDGEATISWSKCANASGYEVYRCFGKPSSTNTYSRLKKLTSNELTSFTHTGLDNERTYYYKVRAYKNYGGEIYYGEFSNEEYTTDFDCRLNGAMTETPGTFTVYNRQKSEAELTSYTKTLSDRDIEILEAFAAEHFPADATREEKLWITLQWIHKNVQYAYAGDLWNEIAGLSWTEAIFVNRKGQCAQYNGAMASMMSWMGFDVSVVQGYRGTWPGNYWQHFWVEIEICGTIYIMECGNLGKNGDWYYFLAPYEETSGFIRHQQNM